jgi:TorA maturation chaperone TorD
MTSPTEAAHAKDASELPRAPGEPLRVSVEPLRASGEPLRAPVELLRALAVLAEPPRPQHAALSAALDLPGVPDAADYADLFLFQLYPYASVHVGAEGMMGGAARDRVAGFWSALGRAPPAEPDHLAALLALYVSLVEEAAAGPTDPERAMAEAGRIALLYEHLTPWIFPFLERVGELSAGPYATWAALLSDVLLAEVRRGTAPRGEREALPAHLGEAGPVPDPREEGADAFAAALLAPARSGFTLVRADLARIAARLDLGLRAGERRYALAHLMGQGAAAVLEDLAGEAERQGAAHAARAGDFGRTATFLAERAAATARLLRELAADAAEIHSPAAPWARH